MEKGLTKNQILSELSRSPHGQLVEYLNVGRQAAKQEGEFLAHLIAWNEKKGQIRDSKVALPVVSLSVLEFPKDFHENSFAHLASLSPPDFLRGYRFALDLKCGLGKKMKLLAHQYLQNTEKQRGIWDRIALQHRNTLVELYCISHCKPALFAKDILFDRKYPKNSLFDVVSHLKDMSPSEAAGTILEKKIPFLIALGALGAKSKDPAVVLALIERMSPTELVTNTKMLERLGMSKNPALKGAFEKGMERTAQSTANILKTTRAAENVKDKTLQSKLRGVQDKQISKISVEGNWLILADRSGSMADELPVAREVAATLAKLTKGNVWLVFFDTSPVTIDATGCSLDVIKQKTAHITPGGSTSIGCGLKRMMESKIEVDGIVVISDGQENYPPVFVDVYKKYSDTVKEVPVYFFHCDKSRLLPEQTSFWQSMHNAGQDLQTFALGANVDYYSLPNMVSTMRTNRYSLVDEIMATPLLTLSEVFKIKGKEVLVHA